MFKHLLTLYFKNICDINRYLKSNNLNYTNHWLFSNYSVFLLNSNQNKYFLRINKYNGFFKNSESIAGIDLIIKDDKIMIDYFMIYDKMFYETYKKLLYEEKLLYGEKLLNYSETNEIKNFLLNYTEKIAKENNLKIIQCDTHQNLNNFNHYFKNEGFDLTNVRCNDNPFWIETYKNYNLF